MSIMFLIFSLEVLNKLDLKVLGFFMNSFLAILECFFTRNFKHSIIPVHTYFQSDIHRLYRLIIMLYLLGDVSQIRVLHFGKNW